MITRTRQCNLRNASICPLQHTIYIIQHVQNLNIWPLFLYTVRRNNLNFSQFVLSLASNSFVRALWNHWQKIGSFLPIYSRVDCLSFSLPCSWISHLVVVPQPDLMYRLLVKVPTESKWANLPFAAIRSLKTPLHERYRELKEVSSWTKWTG